MRANKDYLNKLRHSASHLLAAAVMELYPEAKPTIGPPIENGFYYDFDNLKISEDDLPKIEEKMRMLVKTWSGFTKKEVDNSQAQQLVGDNPFKKELIKEILERGESITMYKSGNFEDLCRGGHIENPARELRHFKLISVAGAYWRGNDKNPMLTRIYGTAFATKKELDEYLKTVEEAKKRDHRKLGRELDLFTFSDYIGSGLPLYTPKGALVRRLLNEFVEEEQRKLGYEQVWTPQIAKAELFKKSGHYEKYKNDMFLVNSNYSDEEFYLKPMNCPQHTQIYTSRPRSYRELPVRYTDFSMLYRDEKPGELNGLARVRSFSQDDCHVFCREDQVDEEVDMALAMTKKVIHAFGLKYRYRLSTRDPEKKDTYLGHPEVWDRVEAWAVEIMRRNGIDYFEGPGEAAFYAPKMDLMATDALGREWQLSTIQVDFVQPERFELKYVDRDGSLKTPVMIHRAVLGSAERFMMIAIEHFEGKFPLWLAPIQVKVLPITERNVEYAQSLLNDLKEANIRTELDSRNETLNAKIRDAQNEKIPYMIILGDKEQKNTWLSLRSRDGENKNNIKTEEFIDTVKEKVENKSLDL